MTRENLLMLMLTNPTVTRDAVWDAWRHTSDVRLRERYHCLLLLMDGKSGPEIAQWLSRDEATIQTWVHACNEGGLPRLECIPMPDRPS